MKIYSLILANLILFGCGSDNTAINRPSGDGNPPTENVGIEPDLPPIKEPEVNIPLVPLEPSTPVEIEPEPPKPTTPIFIGEGISTTTQQPYSGTIIRGGDAYLRYDAGVTDFQDFELPEWTVEYKYQPFLEVLITNGTETLCARYSWKMKGFGYDKPVCLWSDTRQAVPLTDMQAAYYGYSILETRVWGNGVVGLGVWVE